MKNKKILILANLDVGLYKFRKPNDLPFLIMRKRLEIPCRNMAFVGDDIEKDFIAPKALGMECYWKKNEDGLYE